MLSKFVLDSDILPRFEMWATPVENRDQISKTHGFNTSSPLLPFHPSPNLTPVVLSFSWARRRDLLLVTCAVCAILLASLSEYIVSNNLVENQYSFICNDNILIVHKWTRQ